MYIEAVQTREVVGEGDVGRVVPVTGSCSSSGKGYGFSGKLSILLPASGYKFAFCRPAEYGFEVP